MPFRLRGSHVLVALLGFAPLLAVGLDTGGFYSRTWYLATAAFAVAALALALRRPTTGALAVAFVIALTALAVWMLVSAAWGIPGTSAPTEAARAMFYASAALAFVLAVDAASVPAFLVGAWTAIVGLCAYGLLERALGSPERSPFQGALLIEPIGYANALGIVAAMGALLGIGLAQHASTPLVRGLVVLGTGVVGVALLLTESRGAWLAFGCGLVVLFGPRSLRWMSRTRSTAVAAAGTLLVTAGILVVAVAAVLLARQSTSLGHRPAYWRAALDDAAEHPLLGSGAGSFDEYWLANRDLEVAVRDAHSLYLESLAELGIIGLCLVLVVVTIPLAAAFHGRRSGLVSAATAAFVAFVVHAGVDWDWEVPATVLVALACSAALVAEDTTEPQRLGWVVQAGTRREV